MRVVVAGGTGFLGVPLCARLVASGHDVAVLTRRPGEAQRGLPAGVKAVGWDGRALGPWAVELDGADGVINLAGASIGERRWTPERKAVLRSSRLDPTSALVRAIEQAKARPSVFVSQSAVGYYGDCGDAVVTESHPPGSDFLARLCVDWEAAAGAAERMGVRVVHTRTGVVLGRGGGALAPLLTPFKMFVGGPLGGGRQWFPWVHRDDVVGLLTFALQRDDLRGPMNVTAPEPATMRTFAAALGTVLHRPSAFPVPGFALRAMLGELADSLLGGQRAIPVVAQERGYVFAYPSLLPALREAVGTGAATS